MRKGLCFVLVSLAVAAFFSCSKTENGVGVRDTDAAPSFVLSTVKSDRISLDNYKGKVVMVEFFATWCPPCRTAAPEMESIYEKYRDKGFVVLAVSIDEGPTAVSAVSKFVKEFNITYPVLLDDGKASRQYQLISIPTSFIVDKQGKLRNKHIGLSPDFTESVSKEIETLL
ncbi:MAG: TlpA family protein disulfide reductase [Nitrospirae bacterium]|nr:TlpA family protein disulfide reductase [Nitrospirota bacterium]